VLRHYEVRGMRYRFADLASKLVRIEVCMRIMTRDDVSTPEHRAAAAIAEQWQCAWNAHRMDRMASLLAHDVDFVNVTGRWLRGRAEFLEHHVRVHEMQMRESRWTNLNLNVRAISADVVLAHLEWRIEGDRDPDGRSRAPRCGVFTWVVAFDGTEALILAAHNTNVGYADGPTNRESTVAEEN
jgi:uncharacterized protein (TIGR02246 family)